VLTINFKEVALIIKLNFSSENYKFEYDTFCGMDDENIGELADVLLIKLNMHDRSIRVKNNAPNSNILGDITHRMISFIQENSYLTKELVREFCLDAMKKQTRPPNAPKNASIIKVKKVEPKTDGQREYLEKIENNSVVFGLGLAGLNNSSRYL
jgi:phosphate starvation-inducible PhoH-like protein